MNYKSWTFQVDPQTQLFMCLWSTHVPSPYPPVLLAHGYGEHTGRYERLAAFLNQYDFNVWGYDVRGHGRSEGTQGYIETDDILVDDFIAVFNYVVAQTNQTPIVIAHSMGGLTAALAVTQRDLKPWALVLSSPLLRLNMSAFQKCLLSVGLKFFIDKPIKTPAVDAFNVARDPMVVLSYKTDSLNHSMVSPRLGRWMRDGGKRVLENFKTVETPTLLIYAGDDRVVDATGSDDLARQLVKNRMVARRYDDAFHEVFNEPEHERQIILQHMANCLVCSCMPPD